MKLRHSEYALRPRRIASTLCLIGLVTGVLQFGTIARAESGQTSEQVAAEIVGVQAKADAAALKWTELEAGAAQLAKEVAAGQAALDQSGAAFAAMESTMTAVAVNRFMGGGVSAVGLLGEDPVLQLQINALSNVAIGAGDANLDTFEALQKDLADQQANLASLQERNATATAKLLENQQQMDDQLVQLKALQVNLKDAEVKRAYDLQVAELRAKEEAASAQAAAKAEAAAAAAVAKATTKPLADKPTPTASAKSNPATLSNNLVVAPIVAPQTPTTTATTVPDRQGSATPSPAAPDTTESPAPSITDPPARPAPVLVGGSWFCPVAGPNAFGDTYGAPRSGGRSHEGVDMMSPLGTPLVAVVAGFAKMQTNKLGGNVVGLTGADGNYYYYAHLSNWAGSTRDVQAGEVIGYVGHTGDTSADHLHFEIHPGGGGAVNPTSTVRSHC